MKNLCSELFAPTTSQIGFLELPLDAAVEALETWRRGLYSSVKVRRLSGSLPQLLPELQPLIGGARPRELLVEAGPKWTAYFDCLLRGTDPISAIGQLCQMARCHGVAATSAPHVIDQHRTPVRMGAVQFTLFSPLRTDFLNHVRGIEVTFSGSKWEFHATGVQQAFEEPQAYTSRRIRDRFTSDMLERYCRALGIDPFVAESYGPRAALFESDVKLPPGGGMTMTFDEVQKWLGIEPGVADQLPG